MPYKISVIIVDNRRRIFVEEAVKSAIQQTLDRGEYEVIVVKNYDDEDRDRELAKLGVTVLRSGAERGGALYSEGIEAADGEVLALLDDDDRFSHEKLRVVLDRFSKHENLVYYHNSVKLIDRSGNPIDCAGPSTPLIRYICEKNYDKAIFVSTTAEKLAMLKAVTNMQPLKDPFFRLAFNSSSISLRREFVLTYIDVLRKLNFAQDNLHFLEALLGEGTLMHEPYPLTLYRIHDLSFDSERNYKALGPKTYNDYSTIKSVLVRKGGHLGIDLAECEIANSIPILRYALSKRDPRIALEAAHIIAVKLIRPKLRSIAKMLGRRRFNRARYE